MGKRINIFWFRRDLRIEDNHGFYKSLIAGLDVLPIFIFDKNIIESLEPNDARISFIYQQLEKLYVAFKQQGSTLKVLIDDPTIAFDQLAKLYDIEGVYTNKDYEPYALKRDKKVAVSLKQKGIAFHRFKDQVIFEENEILKNDGLPYTVFTPYKNKWLASFAASTQLKKYPSSLSLAALLQIEEAFPALQSIGFHPSSIQVKPINFSHLKRYDQYRDYPFEDKTSYASVHLRFGTQSIRFMVEKAIANSDVYLSELIWRSFFMQIIYHFPQVVEHNFKRKYDGIEWRNNTKEFEKWCLGQTGYPMVDAGMRELNESGYMHNRVRMITAGFLCKHLLIDWRWGEAYFAKKLLDYDLSANNGNWQWAAGTGCDAAPYFRIFNPTTQLQKFDKQGLYIRKWIKDFDELTYPLPIVDHKMARERCLQAYKKGLGM